MPVAGPVSTELVEHREKPDSKESSKETRHGFDVPPVVNNAGVLPVPSEDHLRLVKYKNWSCSNIRSYCTFQAYHGLAYRGSWMNEGSGPLGRSAYQGDISCAHFGKDRWYDSEGDVSVADGIYINEKFIGVNVLLNLIDFCGILNHPRKMAVKGIDLVMLHRQWKCFHRTLQNMTGSTY